jgi:hypothetical protein
MNSLLEFAASLGTATKWHGNHNENAGSIILKAGQLSMVYENGNLRNISSGNHEIIRMIYSAVRDKDWLTINPVISGEEFDIQQSSFRIEFQCQYKSEEINFSARYLIEGHSDNSLNFSFEGEALTTFEKSRIGFCVLHPVEGCAGKSCIITHSDGNNETIKFPVYISPLQFFSDIKSMKWKIDNSDCTLVFSGDVFETEDQRNWTDASYKTYCTPQDLPCPATVKKGEKISQRIELTTEGVVISEKEDRDEIIITVTSDYTFPLPSIGIGRSTRQFPLTEEEIKVLKNLKLNHYRADLYLFNDNWKQVAESAAREAGSLGCTLEVVLFFDNNYLSQSADFIDWISFRHIEISIISLFHRNESATSEILMDNIAPLLKNALPGVSISSGTNANFAQLNSTIPVSDYSDYICYSIHPQEHASDNTTMVENLQAQSYSVDSARQVSGGKGIWISPVNMQRRFNANIENYEVPSTGNSLPPQVDSRMMSLFGACWTAGSLKYLCESGANGVTFFETAGERGIIQGDYPSRWPDKFHSAEGMIFPLFFVFQFILNNKPLMVLKSISSCPLIVNSLIFSDGTLNRIMIMNFTPEQNSVIIKGLTGECSLLQLNEKTFADAVTDIKWLEKSPKTTVMLNRKFLAEPFSVSFLESSSVFSATK